MATAFDFKIDDNCALIAVTRLPLTPDCPDARVVTDANKNHDLVFV
jgi:hypothetical protein